MPRPTPAGAKPSKSATRTTKAAAAPSFAVHYRIEVSDHAAHLFKVTLTVAQPAALQKVSLPVWIPGSYLVREFAGHLQNLNARQGTRALPAGQLEQLDKCSWTVRCNPAKALVLTYEVYAKDASVRTATLDDLRGFFNGTSVCLRVEGQEDAAHGLEVLPPKSGADWSLATGLQAHKTDKRGFGIYRASSYDELVDCPVEMGAFWSGTFEACGVPHRFVVAGAPPSFDGAQLLADTQKICETQIRFWHGQAALKDTLNDVSKEGVARIKAPSKAPPLVTPPPFKSYVFMLNAVDEGYGGLEHRNSTALICNRRDLPRQGDKKVSEGYTTLRGLISHEYFHTWNVKRLRPADFARYDYTRENYTELLWFFEGFTSYYDDLLLRRCGLLDNAGYLKLLNKTINQVLQTPGRHVQAVAQASFDAWVKYYRQDENTPNSTVSYYTKGALVALCFDLSLRAAGNGASQAFAGANLDTVMRALWARCAGQANEKPKAKAKTKAESKAQDGPMSEADFAAELQAASGKDFALELADWVHGRGELPLKALLEQHGVAVLEEPAQLAQRLGLRVSETGGTVVIKTVLHGGAAHNAGLAAGDEWLGVLPASPAKTPRGTAATTPAAWRINKLDDLPLYAGKATRVQALVARDKRLLQLPLTLPSDVNTWRLAVKDAALVDRWLDGAHNAS